MQDSRSDGSVTGEPGKLAAAGEAFTKFQSARYSGGDSREGDVIRGLRSGLVFSLAIWAVLLTVGSLVFA